MTVPTVPEITSPTDGAEVSGSVSVEWDGNYLDLPGTPGNYASTPDSAAVSVTGDIDLRVRAALDDWTPGSNMVLIGRDSTNELRLRVFGRFGFQFAWQDAAGNPYTVTSTEDQTHLTDGAIYWVRVTLDVDNGAGGYEVRFYTSEDGETWTQLGDAVTGGATTDIKDSANALVIGRRSGDADLLVGDVYRAQVYDGIDGTLVADFFANDGVGGGTSLTSSTTGETWAINQSGDPQAEIVSPELQAEVRKNSGAWETLQDWATDRTEALDTTAIPRPGEVDLRVRARDGDNIADVSAWSTIVSVTVAEIDLKPPFTATWTDPARTATWTAPNRTATWE